MQKFNRLFIVGILATVCAVSAAAQEKIDYGMLEKIKDEGYNRSQVMNIASWMTDVYGPRLSNSPSYTQAAHWAQKRYGEYGIQAEVEPYGEIGIGWENKFTSVHMNSPQYMTFIAYPEPWSRGTGGRVISNVVYVNTTEIYSEDQLDAYRGKVRGKIVFTQPVRKLTLNFDPPAVRLSDEELNDMAQLKIHQPEDLPGSSYSTKGQEEMPARRPLSRRKIHEFFDEEGAAVLVRPGGPIGSAPMDKGIVVVSSGRPVKKGDPKPMPSLIVAAEHYNRVLRILEKGIDVAMEVEIRVRYEEEDQHDYNVIAELPGTDLRDELVMIGGHFDAKSSATGATDNASGSATVMEAMRILKAVGARPRRTIRAALWGSEELGHLGSRAYVKKHFGDPKTQEYLPEHEKLSVYFNMDWYGRFRGIYLNGNDFAAPIFEEWMRPFHDVGMTVVSPGNTGGTDHLQFIEVGLPGFQFIEDDLEFFTTTFHTNMDVYDRLVPEDLMQASVIMASFAYNAAMRDEMFPRTKNQMKNNRRWHK